MDLDKFEGLVLEYEKYAFNIAYRICNNIEDAKDITQDAFVKAYKNFDKFKGNSKFSTWLYRIVTNTALDFVRKNKENLNYEENIDYEVKLNENHVEKELEKKELKEVLKESINELKLNYKTMIVLRDLNGLSYDEISNITNESLGTVKSRINRGRKELQKILKRKGVKV
ncbi:MAG: sigma-70 family RNA polymerase sigma factor [Peptostreptococcaceae bacterium]|nr:sigma-70 family RNA polymerase sigma factor [Peptostreptococcaceae bacterium]